MSDSVLLEATALVAGFGDNTVLHGVSFQVRQGEIAGLFGLNGAGKSVTMKVVAGAVPARGGRVVFNGTDVTRLAPEQRVELGIANVPQGRQVFATMTVEENLRVGAIALRRRDRQRYNEVLGQVYERFPVLADRKQQTAGTMSGGEQASLAVGRALMSDPKLLLIDEPSAGLAPKVVEELFVTLRAIADTGMTMLLVEQNVTFGLKLVDTAHILQMGRIVYEGATASLDRDQVANYLGIGRLLGAGIAKATDAKRAPRAKRSPPKPVETAAGGVDTATV
ncbi:MAG: ABC transporter ATP-binding protein [Candidatus Dormibacteria bacterium]